MSKLRRTEYAEHLRGKIVTRWKVVPVPIPSIVSRITAIEPRLGVAPMNAREMAQSFAAQGKTLRAAALMRKLIETEPTPENLTLLAEIYAQQGLFDDAAALHLRVLNSSRDHGFRQKES